MPYMISNRETWPMTQADTAAAQRHRRPLDSSYSSFISPDSHYNYSEERYKRYGMHFVPSLGGNDSCSDESVADDDQAVIDTKGKETQDETRFRFAAESGDERVIKLIAEGAYTESTVNLAATDGNVKAINILFPQGGEIDAKDNRRRTILHWVPDHGAGLYLLKYHGSNALAKPYHATERCPKVPTVVKELTAIFFHEKTLHALFTIALERKSIGAEEFERMFSVCLSTFSTELEGEAERDDQRAAARLAGSHAALIARRIRRFMETDLQLFSPERVSNHDINLPAGLVSHTLVAAEEIEFFNDDDLQDDDQDQTFTAQDLKAFITSSKSLCNLRHKLSRLVKPDVFQAICIEMKLGLEPIVIQQASFRIHWELLKYFREELSSRPSMLATVLTISGNGETAYATSSNDYMNLFWPNTGLQTLQTLQAALGLDIYETQWDCGLRFSIDFSACHKQEDHGDTIITISGSEDHLIEIAQQLAWLSAVFRIPVYDKLTLSDTILKRIEGTEFRLSPQDLHEVNGRKPLCWHSLFTSSVIAHDFPVPPRREEIIGIELPFEAMVALARVIYPMEYYDSIVLKGPSTILIPTARFSDSVQWHFISDGPDKRLTMNSIADHHVSDWFKTCDFDLLRTARTFLGYCKTAEIHLGTSDSSYESVEKSNAKSERPGLETSRKSSLSLGSEFLGFFTLNVNQKFTLSKSLQAMTKVKNTFLEDRLLQARDQPLLLYDTGDKRGWLVPELSVILHIALAWASRQPDRSDIINCIPRAAVSGNGGEAAYNAIMEKGNIKLRTSLDGKPQFFSDLIKNILAAFESRKEMIFEKNKDSVGLRLKRQPLRGWEFIDFVTFEYLFERKEVAIDRTGGWDRIATGNPNLIVLFGKGLGEIIKPARDEKICQCWNPIPGGYCYLTASVLCLQTLASTHSSDESKSPKLTPSHHWYKPQNTSLFEDCGFGIAPRCNRLQELKRKDSRPPGQLNSHGAVIFGDAKRLNNAGCKPPVDEMNIVEGLISCHMDESSSGPERPTNSPHIYVEPSTETYSMNEESECGKEERSLQRSSGKRILSEIDDGNSRSKMLKNPTGERVKSWPLS